MQKENGRIVLQNCTMDTIHTTGLYLFGSINRLLCFKYSNVCIKGHICILAYIIQYKRVRGELTSLEFLSNELKSFFHLFNTCHKHLEIEPSFNLTSSGIHSLLLCMTNTDCAYRFPKIWLVSITFIQQFILLRKPIQTFCLLHLVKMFTDLYILGIKINLLTLITCNTIQPISFRFLLLQPTVIVL